MTIGFLSKFGEAIGTVVRLEAARYVYNGISSVFDRRVREREYENATLLLRNPPRPSEDPRMHARYREQANEALVWLEKNMSQEEYEFFRNKFAEYLEATIPQDNGFWSNGEYSHRYSLGSRTIYWAESVFAIVISATSAVAGMFGDPAAAHNQRAVDVVHEDFFRAKFDIPGTPPQVRRNAPQGFR